MSESPMGALPTQSKENIFKSAIWNLHKVGKYPGPTAINRYLGRTLVKMNNINGQECKWRDEEFKRLEIEKKRPDDR